MVSSAVHFDSFAEYSIIFKIASLQTSYGDLCPFSVALLLSVARIQRYEEQVRNVYVYVFVLCC